MQIAQFMASAALALVFVFAGSGKLLDQLRTRRALVDLGATESAAPLLARILPVTEIATGVLLLVPSTRWFGGTAALVLLAIFVAAMFNVYRNGATADCNCFGRATRSGVGASSLIRNFFFMALSLVAMSGVTDSTIYGIGLPVSLAAVAGIAAFLVVRRSSSTNVPAPPKWGNESPFRWILEERAAAEN